MKKINCFLLLVAVLWSTTAVADVVFDETNFPDENFREAIADAYWEDYGIRLNDGDILTDEMLNYELWLGADEYGIASVQGIEHLAGLYNANFDKNEIEEIDLSHNPILNSINLGHNPLESINLSGCTLLETLTLGASSYQEGRLENLDLSDCVNLQSIYISYEPLIQLDLSHNTLLEKLEVTSLNEMITLNLNNHKKLKELSCSDCSKIKDIILYTPDPLYDFGLGIKSIYIDSCPELNNINYNNQPLLETLCIRYCPQINFINPIGLDVCTGINFSYCNLDSIDLSNIPNVEEVSLDGNKLNEIDISNLQYIWFLHLNNNQIKRIIGIENLESSLQQLFIDNNSLTSIDISNFSRLFVISICGNNLNAIKAGQSLWTFFFQPTFNNGRQIQVYQTDVNGEKQFFIPLATTAAHKGIKDLIEQENNFEDEDTGFDWANVVTESITGATLGELNGEQVLWLDPTTTGATEGLHRMTYQYLTHCPNEQYATVEFYLDWAEATTLRGDVNGDSEVDINDVTLLIDVILGKSVEYNSTAADCNTASGDGTIDINDVTALINYVLAGNW